MKALKMFLILGGVLMVGGALTLMLYPEKIIDFYIWLFTR